MSVTVVLALCFALAATAHLTFQWVVHVVVYPGLADAAAVSPADAAVRHARYTERMARAVAPVYLVLAAGALAALACDGPLPLRALAAALSLATPVLTLAGAVPAHRALSRPQGQESGATPGRHRRLHVVDRWRTALAAGQVLTALALVAAVA